MNNNIIGSINEYLKAYRSQQVDKNNPQNQTTKKTDSENKSQSRDSLELSGIAKKLKTSGVDEVRTEKVEEIKEKISQGNYTMDSGKIAEKIIEESGLDRRV